MTLPRPGATGTNATRAGVLRALALSLLTLPCTAGRAEDQIGGWRPIGHELYEDRFDASAFDSPESSLLPSLLTDLARDGIRYKLNRYHSVGVDVLGEQDPTQVMLQWSVDLY